MAVQERYTPIQAPANATTSFTATGLSGFLAVTSGNIEIRDYRNVVVIPALPVTAGVYVPIPFYINTNGGSITTSEGASGVLGGS